MSPYSKMIGAIVGSVIGMIMIWLGLADAAGIPAAYQPAVDALTMLITTSISTYLFPPNAPPTS